MADDEIVVLAERCKDIYKTFRRMLAGHPKYAPGDRWDPCFLKLAMVLQKNGYDAEAFIQAQFGSGLVFPPNALATQSAIDRYLAAVGVSATGEEIDTDARYRQERERRVAADVGYIKTRLSVGLSLQSILEHRGSPISALTRYCVGFKHGIHSVCSMYRKAAEAQLSLARDHYKELYGELLGDLDGRSS
jgi:hypothetical protein